MESHRDDPFSRANYRALIAWPERLRREGPFLEQFLAGLPDRSVLDVGCGSGEHSRHLAALDFRVTGLDRSPAMIESASEAPLPPNLRFVTGDLLDAGRLITECFGGALCLGNMLPFLAGPDELRRAIAVLAGRLVPGGRLLFQLLNYERLRARNERALPINFRPGDDGEIVFVRLMQFESDNRVLFFPTTLELQPGADDPVRVVRSKRAELHTWTRADLEPALAAAGFESIRWFGTMTGEPFAPMESPDLVGQAVRS